MCKRFVEISKSFFIDPDYKTGLDKLGLTSVDAVFSFNAATNLAKNNLAGFRSRLQFEIIPSNSQPPTTVFLKRYDKPPIAIQLKNWLEHHSRKSMGLLECDSANKLAAAGINTPKTICFGEQWNSFFEKRSFIITEKIPNAESLEQKLPDYFQAPTTAESLKLRRSFIIQLAVFVKNFHTACFRHRDLYLSHIFYNNNNEFYLIDLARVFKPTFLAERFRIKDIAQIYYSAPGRYFSKTDRLRFYLSYRSSNKLTTEDKTFIRKVIKKTKQMAQHDIKHGRAVPFATE